MKANKRKSAAKSADKRRNGDVVMDFGPEIDKVIDHAVSKGYRRPGLGAVPRPGWRPGSFMGGFRPGVESSKLGMALQMPSSVNPMHLVGGSLAGIAANKVLRRLIPKIIPQLNQAIVVDGITAALGVLPYFLVRKNALTIGLALPGVINLAGTLADKLIDATGLLPAPVLAGTRVGSASQTLANAQQSLASLRNRYNAIRPSLAATSQRQIVPSRRVAV